MAKKSPQLPWNLMKRDDRPKRKNPAHRSKTTKGTIYLFRYMLYRGDDGFLFSCSSYESQRTLSDSPPEYTPGSCKYLIRNKNTGEEIITTWDSLEAVRWAEALTQYTEYTHCVEVVT